MKFSIERNEKGTRITRFKDLARAIGLLFGIYRDAMQVILHALYDQSLDYDMRNDICIMED
ncbi:5836_t:CDS:2 [Rhizophagus irregularis]|uniref:Uncharacterized protein n=1 Tax=Rhizophagus irregularis (strain DAOM 181602 / DAOM 197198 / MUCL 43194) TaxID=747089 RepID=U9U9B1_RHIID|nr:5836_t:CDS:2 [Rhizophagus irregularis]